MTFSTNPLVDGVVSSIIASAIVGLAVGLVFPLFRRLFQRRSVDLRGTWDVFDALEPGGLPVGTWKVRQLGNRAWIKIHRTTNRKGEPMDRWFAATGDWQADVLTCVFKDLTGRHRSGAIVLRWRGSGDPMVLAGKTVYWDRTPQPRERLDASQVVANPYSIRRRKE